MKWNEAFSKENKPEFEDISRYVGCAYWDELYEFIEDTYGIKPSIEYSGCSIPGWNVKYRKSSKSLCTLYPEKGQFTCLISIGRKEAPQAELMLTSFSEHLQELYYNTSTYNGSRWLMIHVNSEKILNDVKELLCLRVPPPKNKYRIQYAGKNRLASWMELIELVRSDFPGLETDELVEGYRKTVIKNIERKSAICVLDGEKVIGVLLFSTNNNMLSFLAVHPEYRRKHIATNMVKKMLDRLDSTKEIFVDTYGEGDPQGIVARAFYKKLGFKEGELVPWRAGEIYSEYQQQRFKLDVNLYNE